MIKCTDCNKSKDDDKFYTRSDGRKRRACIECFRSKYHNPTGTAEWRRNVKKKLVAEHGGECVDCGYKGKPWQFDFDHRDPSQKEFKVSTATKSYARLLKESLKCDLVCAICHRDRTHKQRCNGCVDCV